MVMAVRRTAPKKLRIPEYVYHGTTGDPLEILIYGLEAREDRDGVSVSTKPERAKWWAGLKRGDVLLLRIPTNALTGFIPETARPADPRYDFTVDRLINPAYIDVLVGRKWKPMIDVYSEALMDDELEEWKAKWLRR